MIEGSHRRYNQLTGEWVLVSAGRTNRPWQGSVETPPVDRRPKFDADCYLCPGNTRANGDVNPDYGSTYVFTNDFAALQPDVAAQHEVEGLLVATSQAGTCRVICYSPRHDLDMVSMEDPDVRRVVDLWADQMEELLRHYQWVQIFENRGTAVGASNPHPHGQIWAGTALPGEAAKEDATQRDYWNSRGAPLLVDYALQEAAGQRVVTGTDEWVAVVPYWAIWPFEVLLMPRRHVTRLPDLDERQRDELVLVLKDVIGRYDRVFDHPFPYSMGWHGAPSAVAEHEHWQLHAHFYPPLLRSAAVRKHMVGYELLAEAQRDMTAEAAAARLRELAPVESRTG